MEEQKPNKKLIISLSVLVFLAAGSTAGLGYLYLDTKQTSQNAASIAKEKIKSIEQDKKKLIAEKNERIAEESLNKEVNYTAKVGKFSIKLPQEYTIVQELDGDAEGGPATILQLARKSEASSNVAILNDPSFSIHARENLSNQTLDEYIASERQDSQLDKQEASFDIDGVPATVISNAGLYNSNTAYLLNKNIIYTFQYDDSEANEQFLADLMKDFKFN